MTLDDVFPIRQVLSTGLPWARFCPGLVWDWFFMVKNIHIASYSVYICNVPFHKRLGTREWVDVIR